MNRTPREKLLLSLLPSLALLVGYFWFVGRKQMDELGKEQKNLAAAEKGVPSQQMTLAMRAKVSALNETLADREQARAALIARWDAVAGGGTSKTSRAERTGRLGGVIHDCGMDLLVSGPATDGKDAAKLPANLTRVLKEMADRLKDANPVLWRFQVRGRYADMTRVLDRLASTEPHAIPVSVTMKESETSSDLREWTLVVWI